MNEDVFHESDESEDNGTRWVVSPLGMETTPDSNKNMEVVKWGDIV